MVILNGVVVTWIDVTTAVMNDVMIGTETVTRVVFTIVNHRVTDPHHETLNELWSVVSWIRMQMLNGVVNLTAVVLTKIVQRRMIDAWMKEEWTIDVWTIG